MSMNKMIVQGKTFLGIELGSTRIKAILIGEDYAPIASGSHNWENRLTDGIWTYDLEDVWTGLQDCFRQVSNEISERYGAALTTVGALGISAMMHGYLAFDRDDKLLVPFRTWRNTTTERAAAELTELFDFNIPQRWSIAHLYQADLDGEPHVKDVSFITTLAGYVHWKLTGRKVLGIGDASGMFPIENGSYNARMIEKYKKINGGFDLETVLPKVLNAGEDAGTLTAEGARLLDPSGALQAGIRFCPPEGDAGTGMVATNSVAERTGNISAGTSVFAMAVLERDLSRVYTEIDMVTTPTGKPVAMVHCNNCTSDLDAWIKLFGEFLGVMGVDADKSALYNTLYNEALKGDADCGGLLSYNYYGGEPITELDEGRPLFARMPDSRFTLANFMRTLLFSSMGTLKIGMDILTEKEHVRLEQMFGHGGLFKTKTVGQRLVAAALDVPVAVLESAGEGGAWGIALLAAYMDSSDQALEEFLSGKVFGKAKADIVNPEAADLDSFKIFMERYTRGLAIERAAIENLR